MAVQEPFKSPQADEPLEKAAYFAYIDFFASLDPERIVQYHLPEEAHTRIGELLNLSREGRLTEEETFELDECLQFEHLARLIKARARLYLAAGREHESNGHS